MAMCENRVMKLVECKQCGIQKKIKSHRQASQECWVHNAAVHKAPPTT